MLSLSRGDTERQKKKKRKKGRKGAGEEGRSPVNFMRKNVFEIVKYNMKLQLEIQRFLTSEKKVKVLVAKSCLTLRSHVL